MRRNFFSKGGGNGKRNNLFCDFCKKPCHKKDRCYKSRGFLVDYKGTRNKKFATQIQGEISDIKVSNDSTNLTHIPELTKAQYTKLLQLLNQTKEGESSTQLTGYANFIG